MKLFFQVNHIWEKALSLKRIRCLMQLQKVAIIIILLFIFVDLPAQSGGWDASGTTGTTGYTDWGNGVIQLMNTASTGCAGSYVSETSSTYDPSSGATFKKCYEVFFGCSTGSDNIGSDTGGDGMAFSFSKCAYNIGNGNACGGGLGYMGACGQMITIEFDTWSSQCNSNFDCSYGGGTSGDDDEIALQRDGDASDGGRITSVDAGNLEDGKGHWVCITYVPSTHVISVTIDAVSKLSYDLGSTYNLLSYFGSGGLNQTWSSGKYGATNSGTVSNGHDISSVVGTNLGCSVLPVKLISFTGEMKKGVVVLNWATATEINNDKFIIERSINLYDWETIGEVAGAGNSSSVINYNFTDYAPFEGMTYYRLQQVDFDGVYSYSKVIAVESGNYMISVTPNPFYDVLTIKSNLKGDMDISIHDVLGRLMYHTNRKSNDGSATIYPVLPSGAYVITIQTGAFFEQRKIIKK